MLTSLLDKFVTVGILLSTELSQTEQSDSFSRDKNEPCSHFPTVGEIIIIITINAALLGTIMIQKLK